MTAILFKEVGYSLNLLIGSIELGAIGLPDIQRPFVWKATKVRDLFDSMYKGFPVGYFLFWENGISDGFKQIGTDTKQKIPRLLIVDGQQRLTSLYAVLKGYPVLNKEYQKINIQIAFRPKDSLFEVADATIIRNPEFIEDISKLWSKDIPRYSFVNSFIERLRKYREVSKEEEAHLWESIDRLYDLHTYPFTVLELSSTINEEQVAEVFVRINSAGTTLNQADFILTLMSVFWDEGRKQLEKFCSLARQPSISDASPYNHFISPDPDQLLRVSVGYCFRRASLETEKFSEELRIKQFETLKKAQAKVLDSQNWHEFLKCLIRAGFRSSSMISSQAAILYSYVIFLIGKCDFNINLYELRDIVARWFFMVSLSGRYSSSPETKMEADLAKLRNIKNSETFKDTLDQIINDIFTEDFWNINLPNGLATSSSRSPSLFAYYASLNLLEANVLFSKMKIAELIDPAMKTKKSAIERHHLFPKGHLKKIGMTDIKDTNQIANYALVEWGDNIKISDKSPVDYLPKYQERFSESEMGKMYYWHALPTNWENMSYTDFLTQRRKLIATIIKDGYKRLIEADGTTIINPPESIDEIISKGETDSIEFKSTLRINLHTMEKDSKIEHACLKTIAGFLNTGGGKLIIGLKDDGEVLGIDLDQFKNEDKMNLHFVDLIKTRMGSHHMLYIKLAFKDYKNKRILIVDCSPGLSPVYVKNGDIEKLFIRTGAATNEIPPSKIHEYINNHFEKK